jgi:hypothetical protein
VQVGVVWGWDRPVGGLPSSRGERHGQASRLFSLCMWQPQLVHAGSGIALHGQLLLVLILHACCVHGGSFHGCEELEQVNTHWPLQLHGSVGGAQDNNVLAAASVRWLYLRYLRLGDSSQ